MPRLGINFFQREDVTKIAHDLIGKILVTHIGGQRTAGKIVETEAYSWKEKGCHAFNKKRTARTEVMFQQGGSMYVYLCYGVHDLFNIVTNVSEIPEAVLIRAIEPVSGIEVMEQRRKNPKREIDLGGGPGKLTQALGINRSFNGKLLNNGEIWVELDSKSVQQPQVVITERIGIDYAGEDAKLPWRFCLKDSLWVSRKP